jgi:gluconokinase
LEEQKMKEYFIGIDVGTGSVKGLALDSKGSVLSSSQFTYPTSQPDEYRYEQDPESIWQAFTNCIAHLVRDLDSNPRGIAISTAMHSLILVDENAKPITPMITWADNRAGKIAERIKSSSLGEIIYEESGTPVHAMSPLPKIIWFRENHPDVFARAHKFISIKEYIWHRLVGDYEVDYAIASATGLMDIQRLTWNKNSLDLAQIDESKLSRLVDTNYQRSAILKSAAQLMKVSADTPVIIGGSDGCMANLGSFAVEPGIGALTIGTSGAIRVASKKPIFNFKAMTFNYRLNADTFICGGPTNNGGVVLKWYAENLLKMKLSSSSDYHDLLDDVVTVAPGADGLIFLPYILGERAPIWNSEASGVFHGIRSIHTQAHFTRALLEGVSMALYSIGENMQQSGLNIDEINVSGGFVHSSEWLQILADMFGKKICLINTSDASALGAAYIGMKAIGMIDNYSNLKSKGVREVHPKEENFKFYQERYKLFTKLYTQLASIESAQ